MRLKPSVAPASEWERVREAVAESLSRYLAKDLDRPVAVAFSGGGDSLALLLAASAWANGAGRRLICSTVDHGLSPASPAWTAWCAARAARLGVPHRSLAWIGHKPETGRPAAARDARHTLLADVARAKGAAVILMGHTADDRLEARLMRAEGSSVSEPRPWSPSPAWPAGRGVFLLRPMLDLRREALRRALSDLGETWLDDPANDDERSSRARARRRLAEILDPSPPPPPRAANRLHAAAKVGLAGDIIIPLAALGGASKLERDRFTAAALLCAAGTARPPRGDRLQRLTDRLGGGAPFTATLCGARVESDGTRAAFMRDDGAMGARPYDFGQRVFDGRFAIEDTHDAKIMALCGVMGRLPPLERRMLRTLSPSARRGLPVLVGNKGRINCPVLRAPSTLARGLVAERLAAACGVITREADIGRVGETAPVILNELAIVERPVHEPA